MDFINTGNGYLSVAVSVAVAAFMIFLVAFIALNIRIARHYHTTKDAFAAEAWRRQNRLPAAERALVVSGRRAGTTKNSGQS